MINNIKNNAISEAATKKKINELNEIKNVETKGKQLIKSQDKLLSLLDNLKTIFNYNNNNKKIVNEDNNKIVNEDNNKTVNEYNNVNDNDNNNESEDDYDSDSDYDSDNDDGQYYEIRQLNNWFKTIDQIKSLEEKIELLREKGEFLSEYCSVHYYHDNKELNHKTFEANAAYLLNEVDVEIFKKIFGHKFVTLADKLINTTSKEEN